jgi:hypothetical protein
MSIPRKVIVLSVLLLLAAPAYSQSVPTVMNYQGSLTDNTPTQTPVDATLPMKFRIYDAFMGGTQEWEEVWGAVMVTDGIFNVMLGSNATPIPSSVFTAGAIRYLEIEVGGELLTPRQRLGSVGFAHQAETSADLECPGCVEAGEIAAGAVGTSEVEDDSLTEFDLANDSVGASEIAAGAVGTSEVENESLTAFDLATDSVTANEISANAVGNSELANGQPFEFSNLVTFKRASGQKFVTEYAGVTKLEWWAANDYSYLFHRPNGAYLSVNDATGNWGINTADPAGTFHVVEPDTSFATIAATGVSQGAGILYAGQSPIYGGGIAYDGDNNPDIVGGVDRITFFRRSNGVDSEVMSYSYAADKVAFAGDIDVAGTALLGLEVIKADSVTQSNTYTCRQGGAWTCYLGGLTVSCPVGKVVVGGGCTCSFIDTVCTQYPVLDPTGDYTGWSCGIASADPSEPFSVFAICARLGD